MTRSIRGAALRFAGVGTVNTLIDTVVFMMLHERIGIFAANVVSTSAGMAFSFVVNGLFTFGASALTVRQALLFIGTTGATMWLVQPLLIHGLLSVVDEVLVAKLLSIGVCVVVNFAACRIVVWPAPRAVIDTQPIA